MPSLIVTRAALEAVSNQSIASISSAGVIERSDGKFEVEVSKATFKQLNKVRMVHETYSETIIRISVAVRKRQDRGY